MGILINLSSFRDGRQMDDRGRTSHERILDRLGKCSLEQPVRSGWICTIKTDVSPVWFQKHALIAFRHHDGGVLIAELLAARPHGNDAVCIVCDFPEDPNLVQHGGGIEKITEPGYYVITKYTDEWKRLDLEADEPVCLQAV